MQHLHSARLVAIVLVAMALMVPSAHGTNTTHRTEHFQIIYPTDQAALVQQVISTSDAELERLQKLFGYPLEGDEKKTIQVIIAADAQEFHRAQPGREGMDPWMVGTAYPSLDLIILSLAKDNVFKLPEIARHEISHMALYLAAGRQHMPRWLDEGLAILNAGESVAARLSTAAGAAWSGELLPLGTLYRRFPSETHRAQLAYAQSVLFVRWLIHKHDLEDKLPEILRKVREGTSPIRAMETELGDSLADLHHIWARDLKSSWSWLSLVTGDGAMWVLMVFIFLWAYAVKRRKNQEKLQRMTEEEEETWPPSPVLREEIPPLSDDG